MCDAGHTSMAYFYFDFRDIKNKVRNAVAVAHPRDSDNVQQDIAIYFALNALLCNFYGFFTLLHFLSFIQHDQVRLFHFSAFELVMA